MIIEISSLVVTVLFGVIAINQSLKSQNYQEKLAESQKIFSKSKVKIEFFRTTIRDIIFIGNFPTKSISVLPLETYICNIGDKKLENAELYITYPDPIHESNTKNVSMTIKGSLKDIPYKLVDKSEFKHMIGYDLGNIQERTANYT